MEGLLAAFETFVHIKIGTVNQPKNTHINVSRLLSLVIKPKVYSCRQQTLSKCVYNSLYIISCSKNKIVFIDKSSLDNILGRLTSHRRYMHNRKYLVTDCVSYSSNDIYAPFRSTNCIITVGIENKRIKRLTIDVKEREMLYTV